MSSTSTRATTETRRERYASSPPRDLHEAGTCPLRRTWFTAEMFEDLAKTIEGGGESYSATGEDGRRAVEVVFAAYQAAATKTVVSLPLAKDELYRDGLAALHSSDVEPIDTSGEACGITRMPCAEPGS